MLNLPVKIILLFSAGGLGTLARFGLTSLAGRLTSSPSPLATSIVNILGCFCFGMIAESFRLGGWPAAARTIILTGFFGAFTTFSTYMYEIESFMMEGNAVKALLGFAAQNILGFLGIVLGVTLAKLFVIF